MSTTEHLSVLVSIIIGLGISHLLAGAARLLAIRHRVRPYGPATAAAALVFLTQIQFWWSNLGYGERIESNFFAFLFFLVVPILLYVLSVLVLPDNDQPGEISLKEHYWRARPWFYSLAALIPIASAARNVVIQRDPLLTAERPFEVALLLLVLSALASRSERYHRLLTTLALLLFMVMIAFAGLRPG